VTRGGGGGGTEAEVRPTPPRGCKNFFRKQSGRPVHGSPRATTSGLSASNREKKIFFFC
jgi:hypothetical protein